MPFAETNLRRPAHPLPIRHLPFALVEGGRSGHTAFQAEHPTVVRRDIAQFQVRPHPVVREVADRHPSERPSGQSELLTQGQHPGPDIVHLPDHIVPNRQDHLPRESRPFPKPRLHRRSDIDHRPVYLVQPRIAQRDLRIQHQLHPSVPGHTDLVGVEHTLTGRQLIPDSTRHRLEIVAIGIQGKMVEQPCRHSHVHRLRVIFRHHLKRLQERRTVAHPAEHPLVLAPAAKRHMPSHRHADIMAVETEMLRPDRIDGREITISARIQERIQFAGRQQVIRTDHDRRPPFPLLQRTQTQGDRTVLVPFAGTLDLQQRAPVGHLHKRQERQVHEIVSRIISPLLRQHLLRQIIASCHERTVLLHIGRRDVQQTGNTQRALGD